MPRVRSKVAPRQAWPSGSAAAPVRLSQDALEQLAGAGLRQGIVAELDRTRHLVTGDQCATVLDQLVFVRGIPGAQRDNRMDGLPPARVGNAEDRRLGDR